LGKIITFDAALYASNETLCVLYEGFGWYLASDSPFTKVAFTYIHRRLRLRTRGWENRWRLPTYNMDKDDIRTQFFGFFGRHVPLDALRSARIVDSCG
jgi:hypothetical protein